VLAQFAIGEEEASEISAFYQIAKQNGSALTLAELLEATSMVATEADLEAAWRRNPTLSSRYSLELGLVFEKGERTVDPSSLAAAERQSVERSRRNLLLANELASLCVDERVKMIAVGGGNSYRRSGPRDDIDLFCVTAKDSLWIFMFRSLLLARLYSFGRRGSPPFCFSYVLDEGRAHADFRTSDDGLFARDALMAFVLHGRRFYQSLLTESPWMRRYFPVLYNRKSGGKGFFWTREEGVTGARPASRIANSFLYHTVGTYIRMKAYLLNGRFLRQGNLSSVFRAKVATDCCIYESNRYRRLREIYDDAPRRARGSKP